MRKRTISTDAVPAGPGNGYGRFVLLALAAAAAGFALGEGALLAFGRWHACRLLLGPLALFGWSASALSLLSVVLATFIHIRQCITLRRIRRHGLESFQRHNTNSNKPF